MASFKVTVTWLLRTSNFWPQDAPSAPYAPRHAVPYDPRGTAFITSGSDVYAAGCEQGAVNNGSPAQVAAALGGVSECFILLVMMTSSLSTLDSTFTSCAKLIALEVSEISLRLFG